ncbi:MAG: hypothetical protein ISS15_10450 [Alphaproteobacteria bacterium]|nr:hypothetical protein [Alphaproteobacteria bacterium]MBL7098069.1 hypothetical protein [Alphaproteobacteria bacterium]
MTATAKMEVRDAGGRVEEQLSRSGVLLMAADRAIRSIGVVPELGLGVVTALLGTPASLYLIFMARREAT